jgi:hypothetical protein
VHVCAQEEEQWATGADLAGMKTDMGLHATHAP